MNLSNPQRVIKLIKDLASKPLNVPRYLSCLPLWKRSPLNLAMPWWSFSAIDFMSKQCRADQDVFEFGSGGSTLFFAKRCKTVTAVEDDAT